MTESDAFLRELHHRVKNNFQIIASLINLQKRLLPPERRGDLRFIEEHVQSMAVAYRVVWAANESVAVSVSELVSEVLDSLKYIADCPKPLVALDLAGPEQSIGLNQAIALSLYLAVMVPPFIDYAIATEGAVAHVALVVEERRLRLTFTGSWATPIEFDYLRSRLADAYMRQLNAETQPHLPPAARGIRFSLELPNVGLG